MIGKIKYAGLVACLSLICVCLATLTGCPTAPSTASLELHLDSMARTIVPEGTSLFVTAYTVMGKGPDGQNFKVNSNNSLISVDGLNEGMWNLTATGHNTQGVALVSGHSDIALKKDRNVVSIALDSMVGIGTLSMEITWKANNIVHAGIHLMLVDEEGKETILAPNVFNESRGMASVSVQVPAGSYSLCIQLTESGALRAGHVTALRVVDGLVSEGIIHLALDEPTHPPYSFLLENKTGVPVSCRIIGADKGTLSTGPVTSSLEVEDGLALDDLVVNWFLNGRKVGDGSSVTFTPPQGYSRLDVIARGPQSGTMGSTGWQFKVTQGSVIPGVPSFKRLYKDGENNLRTTGVECIAFLGDGNFILSSSGASTLQLCKIVREEIHVLATYDASSGYPVQDITDIYADQASGRVLTASSSPATICLYQYDSTYSKLVKKFIELGSESSPSFTRTGRLGRFAHFEEAPHVYVVMFNPDGYKTPIYDLSANNPKEDFFAGSLKWSANYGCTAFPYVCLASPSKNALLVISPQETKIRLTNRVPGSLGYGSYSHFGTDNPEKISINGLSSGILISDSCALIAHGEKIEQIECDRPSVWSHARTYQSGQDGIPAFAGITDMVTDALGTLLFTSIKSQEGKVMSFSIDDSAITYLGSASIPDGNFTPARIFPSPDGQWLLATGLSGGLALYEVPRN
ncbi:hypothetical protein [Parasphaerochaeta coccoides]|uniref:Uncharacterized protein n=1 Tax=Parasphaerochaeta coccoides (strain ATCC BAA-1237 / DSM 17374 / SPN1) TaxID=760011 RepID=F4GI71_PARC1|nr:hypothetical protein [Parasphaerochaeta coccoides]AEC02669.1 hypothetical protein Spico_1466 [Parasphaerochaeta coccoides DSM 17374]